MKPEWLKNWKWGFDIYPRSCCCSYYPETHECACAMVLADGGEEFHECTWSEGPKAYLALLIGPEIEDMELFRFEIKMEDLKQIYNHFYVEHLGFGYKPQFYPMKRRRLNNHGCVDHLRIFEDCRACQRLIRQEKRILAEEKFLEEYRTQHSEENVFKRMMEERNAFEEKRKREENAKNKRGHQDWLRPEDIV